MAYRRNPHHRFRGRSLGTKPTRTQRVRFADDVSVSSFDMSGEEDEGDSPSITTTISVDDLSPTLEGPPKGILKVPLCRFYAHKQLEKEAREQSSLKGKMRRFMSRSKSPNSRATSPFSSPRLRRASSFGDFEDAIATSNRGPSKSNSLSPAGRMTKTRSNNVLCL
jgi:hypothetical protein